MVDPQSQLQSLMDQQVREGRERGLQLTVYHRGKKVIDACAGVTNAGSFQSVMPETLFPVFSTTKGIVATLAHLLVERGKISYDTPIAEVWPEFAANGKGGISFRHALSHAAGLQNMPVGMTLDEMNDWTKACAVVAKAMPVAAPGAVIIYHAVMFGWIVGETMRRVDGRPFAKMMVDEICKPLGLTGMFVGLPASDNLRVAELEEIFPPEFKLPAKDDPTPQSVSPLIQPLYAWMNTTAARRACVPASNGIMNTRSVARHYAALIPGGVDGVELLPPARIRAATQIAIPNGGTAEGNPKKIALGYFLGGDPNGMSSRLTAFGHAGYGGSIGFADPEQQLAVAFNKNLYSSRGGGSEIFRAVRESLGIPH